MKKLGKPAQSLHGPRGVAVYAVTVLVVSGVLFLPVGVTFATATFVRSERERQDDLVAIVRQARDEAGRIVDSLHTNAVLSTSLNVLAVEGVEAYLRYRLDHFSQATAVPGVPRWYAAYDTGGRLRSLRYRPHDGPTAVTIGRGGIEFSPLPEPPDGFRAHTAARRRHLETLFLERDGVLLVYITSTITDPLTLSAVADLSVAWELGAALSTAIGVCRGLYFDQALRVGRSCGTAALTVQRSIVDRWTIRTRVRPVHLLREQPYLHGAVLAGVWAPLVVLALLTRRAAHRRATAGGQVALMPAQTGDAAQRLHPAVQSMCRLVDQDLTQDLSLKRLSYRFSMNATYLGQLFKQETGEYYTHYLNRKRIARAKDLLAHTNRKSTEISRAVGLPDPNYFYRLFRRETGLSPVAYRRCVRASAAVAEPARTALP